MSLSVIPTVFPTPTPVPTPTSSWPAALYRKAFGRVVGSELKNSGAWILVVARIATYLHSTPGAGFGPSGPRHTVGAAK